MAKKKLKTKGEALVEFVLDKYEYSKNELAGIRSKWLEYYNDYRGTVAEGKEPWQANYIIPTLKDVVRTKVPLYANIYLPMGLKVGILFPVKKKMKRLSLFLKTL